MAGVDAVLRGWLARIQHLGAVVRRIVVLLPLMAAVPGLALGAGDAAPQPAAPETKRPPVERTYRGTAFRLPRDYVDILFSDGFHINVSADDLKPYGQRIGPGFRHTAISIYVGDEQRFSGRDSVRRRIQISASSSWHHPAEPADQLDGPGGPPVPTGLQYHMALPGYEPASGTREDMFVPEEPRRTADGAPLPEAIFCLSPNAPIVQRRIAATGLLGCTWRLVWRDFSVTMLLDRRHIPRWRELRDGVLTLLDGFVIAGPAEALPPEPPTTPEPKDRP